MNGEDILLMSLGILDLKSERMAIEKIELFDGDAPLDEDAALKAKLGEEFSASYIKMKMQEWTSFVTHFSQWERDTTLDI